jgi:Aerotolerance regulator N-terminal
MSFLQPWLLAALPLAALPIIIHLINQRRYQTMRWGAMMFLLAANRMSRGYARLRQWLIMAARIAAIAGLIFAASRPLAGGWLGLAAGGRPDTTLVLLDRSPSMEQEGAGGGGSKRETGVRRLASALETVGSAKWVVVGGAGGASKPRSFEAPAALPVAPEATASSASADLPAMLQAAHDYIAANKSGTTEVWLSSDLRAHDWNPDDARWKALRDAFRAFPQRVRFHLLAYAQTAPENLSVRVTDARRRETADGAELLISLRVAREGGGDGKSTVPVRFEIDGASSEVAVELAGPRADLKDYRIPVDKSHPRGWGRVSIPADANPADNDYYFAFGTPAPRRTLIVADDPQAARPLALAAEVAPEPGLKCAAEVIEPGQLGTVDWEGLALLLWQAPLPDGDAATKVASFVGSGGQVIFLPPKSPAAGSAFGMKWTSWHEDKNEAAVENWRGDEDLLAHTKSGAALPVGKIKIRRSCGLEGTLTPLATLRGGAPLLGRVSTDKGGVYFCATTPSFADSSLAADGVVLYVLIQRALAAGAATLEGARQLVAGAPPPDDPSGWNRLAGASEAVSTEYPLHRGVYASGDRLFAVNRSEAEDAPRILNDERLAELFRGLDYSRVDDQAGTAGSLIQEVWRLFLTAMIAALIAEAALCLPRRPVAPLMASPSAPVIALEPQGVPS